MPETMILCVVEHTKQALYSQTLSTTMQATSSIIATRRLAFHFLKQPYVLETAMRANFTHSKVCQTDR